MVAASFYCSLLILHHLLKKSSPINLNVSSEKVKDRKKGRQAKTRERKGEEMGVEGREVLGREGNGGKDRAKQLL